MFNPNALAFLTGFVSILSQVLLIREAINSFSGNELILSMILGVWLFFGGAGAFLVKKIIVDTKKLIFYSLSLTALFLPLQIFYLRYLHGIITISGIPSIDSILLHTFIVISPSSILYGALFSSLSAQVSQSLSVSKLYVYECAGATIGSLLYVFFLLAGLHSITLSLLISLITNLFLLLTVQVRFQKSVALAQIMGAIFCLLYNIETKTLAFAYPGQSVISEKQSPYGTLVLTSTGGQINLYENGIVLTASGDSIMREELAHFAMVQRPYAKNVLIIGGGYSGVIEEIKKYKVEKIDYIDIDPAMIKIIESFYPHFLSSAEIHLEDARKFLNDKKNKYDVILIYSPLPLTGSLNRFYTYEFFAGLRDNLNPGGIIGFGLAGSETYIGKELRELHSSIYRALRPVFKEILILPGQKIFYIAGDRPLTEKIGDKIEELKIKTEYVNKAYLRGLTEERLLQAKNWVITESKTNYDLAPAAFKYYLNFWLKQFSSSKNYASVALIIFILLTLYNLLNSKKPLLFYVSFTNGFTGISIEITLLTVFQVIYSTLYMDIGLLLSAFMLGMATGGLSTKKLTELKKVLFLSEFSITLFPLFTAVLLSIIDLHLIPLHIARLLFFILLFAGGFLIGAQFYLLFPYASESPIESASGIYSADLLGSCAGALLTGIFIIPAWGVLRSLIILTLIKATSAFFLSAHLFGRKLTIPYREWHLWAVFFLIILVVGLFIINDNILLYSFSKSNLQTVMFLASILIALFISGNWLRVAFTEWFKLIQFLVLSLVAFYPVFRCFFKIPYLFCHVCPRQCAFGIYRKYIVLVSTITNASTWPFCHTTCPIGIMYDAQPLSEGRLSKDTLRYFKPVRFLVLLSVPFLYFKSKFDERSILPTFLDVYNAMFKNEYSVSIYVIIFAGLFIVGGFFIPRFFCNLLCPIGAIADMSRRVSYYFKQFSKNNLKGQRIKTGRENGMDTK